MVGMISLLRRARRATRLKRVVVKGLTREDMWNLDRSLSRVAGEALRRQGRSGYPAEYTSADIWDEALTKHSANLLAYASATGKSFHDEALYAGAVAAFEFIANELGSLWD